MDQPQSNRGADPSVMTTGRPPAMGTRFAVASPHALATQAGYDILRQGGHAVDACIAVNATLCVTLNHMAGLGGDLFCQVWQGGELGVLNGSGRSGEKATIDFYREQDLDEIPKRGPMAANTVPGTVDAWKQLHDRYGRLDWDVLFQPAIRAAEDGFPISERLRDYISEYRDTLEQFESTRRIVMPGGEVPKTGDVFRQADLARSLRIVAEKGPDAFYRGELMERILDGLRKEGGILTESDFREHRSDWVDPVQTTYRGLTVSELPPNTQGFATLILLNLIEPQNLREIGDNTADYYHLMTEAVKLAFAERDHWLTDPEFLDIPMERLISKEFAERLRSFMDFQKAKEEDELGERVLAEVDQGDTVYLCAVDADGNCCSLIQSVYFEFGSAFVPEGTGVFLQNRGSFFKLDPDHPNRLQPRKRTFHTIIPAMALRDGQPFMLFGTMGGEGQPQTQTAMLTRVVDFGYNIQQAIEAPRWLYGRTWGEESRTLKLEGRIPDYVANELKRRGHDVEMKENWSQDMGHAQGIVIDRERGILQAGADPRGDGLALAD
jgi:gamma-glutamyltranspeptidase